MKKIDPRFYKSKCPLCENINDVTPASIANIKCKECGGKYELRQWSKEMKDGAFNMYQEVIYAEKGNTVTKEYENDKLIKQPNQ